MKELKEFAQISAFEPITSDQRRLYDMALTGISRQEAKATFEISETHFNVLYKKLKEQMARGVLDSPLKGFSRSMRQKVEVRRQYETAIVMLQTGHKEAGIPLARATMKKAEKLGLYQVAMDLCRELLNYYSTVDANLSRHEQYFQKLWFYWREIQNELQAECTFYSFVFNLKKDMPSASIEEQLQEMNKVASKSYRFHYMRLLTEVIHYEVAGRERDMIEACKKALDFFEQFDELPYVIKYSFIYRLIPVHLANCNFSEAEEVIDKSLDGPVYGRHNWQVVNLFHTLLGFHTGNQSIALDTYQKAVRAPKKYRTKEMTTRWDIVRAYLELFEMDIAGSWSLKKFLKNYNDEENGLRDNKFSVMLVELLHQLKNKDYEQFEKGLAPLKKYIKSEVKEAHFDRFINFHNLLASVVDSKYDADTLKETGQAHLIALQKNKRSVQSAIEDCEVIPFERIWYLMLKWLEE